MPALMILNETDLTPGQRETIAMLSTGEGSISRIEAWAELNDEPDLEPVMGLSFTDDGLTMVGYFDAAGCLMGDWSC